MAWGGAAGAAVEAEPLTRAVHPGDLDIGHDHRERLRVEPREGIVGDAPEDEERRKNADARNTLEQLVYQGEKLLKDNEDKVPGDVKTEVETAVEEIEARLRSRGDADVPSTEIGRLATDALRELDQLAYIRFASVYHAYDDIETLQREVDRLIRSQGE